ncbi:transposase (plasmid) [Leptolyngbya boryana NIES-2135]|jgi:IS5 family transposase|uniref:Transposase n=1 Tax=Leptolyngbya boryana NIES-2135 TaxID=1973484 RepID=A0A1Z4JTB1_LEPBY|nr:MULTISPECIES: IS5 family transposase [Leptolyngbya]BAY59926.1 transposase [Leptolyngbya boryana NIES-2135]MBD2371507.1 IS5 family transposase [Leptolyngbya sp. FACHB-161]MBD2378046.1 IS5 family transposase [Leptolyngbya sp. FACHB-238]MBD2402491.1 IS5 family transposase [Leptolyngbya sp. FACHB-239]MBD2408978.1 IS5 family transposase [Leptolyngbya sp. FACHB-402]
MSYRIRNWSEYNAGLRQRGSLTFWIDESVLETWIIPKLSGKPGASVFYSDLAITTMITLKSIYGLAGRQCQGFLESIFVPMEIDLLVPDHSTLSRRLGRLSVALPVLPKGEAKHVVVDSTGVKVYGEGEWKTRQHGISKRRTWRKLHLGVDEQTGEILAAMVTTNDVGDGQMLSDLLDQIEDEIEQVSADGAYDQNQCYDAIRERKARATIPPRRGAKIWHHGNRKTERHNRDENLRRVRKVGRRAWKQESNYHRRSLSETTMFLFKTIFGSSVRSRKFDNQAVELFIKCAALNRMIQVAKPDSYRVEA